MAARGADVDGRIAVAMRAIRSIHGSGTRIADQVRRADGGIAAVAAKAGVSVDRAYRRRQFADPRHGYTSEDLDRYEELCVRHGQVPRIIVLQELLLVEQGPLRNRLLKEAVARGWSKQDLGRAIRKRQPRQRRVGGGRPPHVEQDVPGLLRQIEEHGTRWSRWVAAAESEGPVDGLPKSVRRKLRVAVDAMRELLDVAAKASGEAAAAGRGK
jgi:hypothetical protein